MRTKTSISLILLNPVLFPPAEFMSISSDEEHDDPSP